MAEIRNCENCTKPIDVPPHALNKRFCCETCRNSWHNKRYKEARAYLDEQARKEAGELL